MAEKRMFAKTIIDSDAFLDMSLSTQALYFHLNMRADDDGFINNPKKIQRMIGCGDDELKLLTVKKFIIPFENGVCVIKHWLIHNYIRKDTYRKTVYTDEKSLLGTKENKTYTLEIPPSTELLRECNDTVPQTRLDKISIDKVSIDKKKATKQQGYDFVIDSYTSNLDLKATIINFIKMRVAIKATMTDNALNLLLKKLDKLASNDNTKIEIIEQSIMNSYKGIFPLKEGNNGSTRQNNAQTKGKWSDYKPKQTTGESLTESEIADLNLI